jgi:membrane protein YqaA with SNARE-associated domain
LAGFYFQDFFSHSRGLGLLGIFIINFFSSATFFVSGPAFLSVIAGGNLYNPLLVALVAALAASLGDLVSFTIGYSGRSLTYKHPENHKWLYLLESHFKKYGLLIVFLFALIPNPVFDAIGIIAGIFGLKPTKFFIIMLTGRFLRFILLAFTGAKFI